MSGVSLSNATVCCGCDKAGLKGARAVEQPNRAETRTDATIDAGGLQTWVAAHSLAWLVAANMVGVLLAAMVLWPGINEWIAPLTYGRWIPLHLDWQLYGWCALPLVG